ncbi:hypothetical protein B0H17DRAFT_1184718 [Mycena rosella]|uniref:Uncharacterized protein n=1 Tax=Mycena rosella TaxID=1033263 RepID=A0AAD7G474_MYCRO|nr:hypothetical protein B0H17DRAFT_1184718 [Mycena rosella]
MDSFQTDRFRCIFIYSRRSDQSVEQFREALQNYLNAREEIPIVQRCWLSRELCWSMSDSSSLVQLRPENRPGESLTGDSILILDYESVEAYEEVNILPLVSLTIAYDMLSRTKLLRDPQVMKLKRGWEGQFMFCQGIMSTKGKK